MFNTLRKYGSRILRRIPSSSLKNFKDSGVQIARFSAGITSSGDMTTVGGYLATRLADAGLEKFFCVPGDYNLILLDKLIEEPRLQMVGNCNELNGGYAADGYARAKGLSVFVVTYMVGGLSAINAVAGAYSDDLPLLLISGGPNTNDAQAGNIVHHTIGTKAFYQQEECFKPVVEKTFAVRMLSDASTTIDDAIRTCLYHRKPVYLEIACNLAGAPIKKPTPIDIFTSLPPSDSPALQAAVDTAVKRIEASVKPTLLGGVKLRPCRAESAFLALANQLGCGVAIMPDAKGLFPESHKAFMGTYWGSVSSPTCAEVVESSDLIIAAGPLFNDFTTTGWSTLVGNPSKMIIAGENYVDINGQKFHNVYLADFLEALKKVTPRSKTMSLVAYDRFHQERTAVPLPAPPNEPLTLQEFRRQLQDFLTGQHDLFIETGDSWFNGQKLKLPDGASYHFQCQYGSVGWALGAALGYSLGSPSTRRAVAIVGDGAFQMSAQEISTMIRENVPVILFLMNNRGYTIDVKIHDGPYNDIKNWSYSELVDVFNAGEGHGKGVVVKTGQDLEEAMKLANKHKGFILIECQIDRNDCSAELLEWGNRVATAGGRPAIEFKQFR